MLLRLAHSINAPYPIEVMLFGITMLVRFEQLEKAYSPIEVTLPSSGITLAPQPATSIFDAVSIIQFPAL